jgi:peptidyl-prolyl cis-trans isomerase SurA
VKFKLSIAGLSVATCIAGILCAQLCCRSISCRNAFGLLFARGRLLAIVHGSGIYEVDVQRAAQEAQSRGAVKDSEPTDAKIEKLSILSRLIANVHVDELARRTPISRATIDRDYGILQHQLRPEAAWLRSLRANGFSNRSLQGEVTEGLQAQRWIEQQIATGIQVTSEECLRYYEAHPELYAQVMRFRGSHLFLAAPPGTPAEVVDAKRRAIERIFTRLAHGEKFADLVRVASEDEATKTCAGDLNYFSESRMPPDFFAAIKGMRVGETSSVVHTCLGFHIVQLTDAKPGGEMTFAQSEAEIRLTLENWKRRTAIEGLEADLSHRREFIAVPPL